MAKIDFKIVDPKVLDKNEPRAQMTYGDTDSPIVIDTETAFIECEPQGKSEAINKWVVDFENRKMKLADDATDGNYQEIDFATAMGMVGQLVMEVGVSTLQKLLGTLKTTYAVGSNDEPAPKSPESDAPGDKLPELPKLPEIPNIPNEA